MSGEITPLAPVVVSAPGGAVFEKLGQLTFRWAHLKRLLRLSDEDAIIVVFSMSVERRFQAINELVPKRRLNKTARAALEALNWVLRGPQGHPKQRRAYRHVRGQKWRIPLELRSKERRFPKKQVLASEELTNYAAHTVPAFRLELGLKSGTPLRQPLPNRPAIPACLQSSFQAAKNPSRNAKRQARRRSSRGSRRGRVSGP
jgi:hypothetical protein